MLLPHRWNGIDEEPVDPPIRLINECVVWH